MTNLGVDGHHHCLGFQFETSWHFFLYDVHLPPPHTWVSLNDLEEDRTSPYLALLAKLGSGERNMSIWH